MSGVVKAVKKVFKSVVNVIKKIWKPLLVAAAVYFTAGLALSAFAPTASFAASMPGFAGGGLAGTGIGAGASAGTGVFCQAAAHMGLGTLGSSGGLAGGALAAGTPAASLASAGFSGAAIGEATGALAAGTYGSAAQAAAGGVGSSVGGAMGGGSGTAIVPGTGPTTATPAAGAGAGGGSAGAASGAATGGTAGGTGAAAATKMTLGEKLLLGSVGTQAVGTLIGNPADTKWQGAFYGVNYKGKGEGPIDLTKVGTQAPAGVEPEGEKLSAAPSLTGEKAKAQAQQQAKPTDLFAPPQPPATTTGQPRRNQKVRYI